MRREVYPSISLTKLNPTAGDYVVSVYPEASVREDIAGKIGGARYAETFPAEMNEQAQ